MLLCVISYKRRLQWKIIQWQGWWNWIILTHVSSVREGNFPHGWLFTYYLLCIKRNYFVCILFSIIKANSNCICWLISNLMLIERGWSPSYQLIRVKKILFSYNWKKMLPISPWTHKLLSPFQSLILIKWCYQLPRVTWIKKCIFLSFKARRFYHS